MLRRLRRCHLLGKVYQVFGGSLQLYRPRLIEPPVLAQRAFVAAPDAVFGAEDAEVEGEFLAGRRLTSTRMTLTGSLSAAVTAMTSRFLPGRAVSGKT